MDENEKFALNTTFRMANKIRWQWGRFLKSNTQKEHKKVLKKYVASYVGPFISPGQLEYRR